MHMSACRRREFQGLATTCMMTNAAAGSRRISLPRRRSIGSFVTTVVQFLVQALVTGG